MMGAFRTNRRQRHHLRRQRGVILLVVLVLLSAIFVPTSKCQEVTGTEETVTTTEDVDVDNLQRKLKEENEKRLWGASTSLSSSSTSTSSSSFSASMSEEDAADWNSSTGRPVSSIPFVMAKSTSKEFYDPFAKGFQISARVYTDPRDKLAHFDIYDTATSGGSVSDDDGATTDTRTKPIVFPYWECGVTGSTTVPIPLQHVTVRHLLGGSKPSSFASEGDFGPNPQLVIPLTNVQILLNSGEVQTFSPGQVILLENVITGGHKLQGHEQHDMTILLLTLPHAYHQVGKEHNALQSIFEKSFWRQNPCKTGLMTTATTHSSTGEDNSQCSNFDSASRRSLAETAANSFRSNVLAQWVGPPRVVRRVSLGIIGMGLSLAVADFLGKCAPLILAVAFGGGAIVLGGTYGLVKLGEYGLDELDIWHEKRLLRLSSSSSSASTSTSPDDGGNLATGSTTKNDGSTLGDERAKRRIPESAGTETTTAPLRAFSSAQEYKQQAQPRAAAQ